MRRFELENGRQITCAGRIVFRSTSGTIIGFDLAYSGGSLLAGALIKKAKGTFLAVYDAAQSKYLAVKELTSLNPWKLRFFDADGDGTIEVCLGVYKKSPLHPVWARRLFLYTFDGGSLRPKWLGSRLAHPFVDFDLTFQANRPVLYAIELDRQGRRLLCSYHWDSFGFSKTRDYPGALPQDVLFGRGCLSTDRVRHLLLMRRSLVWRDISEAGG